MGKSMLLVACSNRKKENINSPAIAIDVYDGVFYRVIKKAYQNNKSLQSKLSIYILSAKYGIIPSDHLILPYNLKMTKESSFASRSNNTEKVRECLSYENPDQLAVVMSSLYRSSIIWDELSINKFFISGGIGVMQHQLKNWLMSL